METWRFKRSKSNRRLQLWTPECRRKAATPKAGARTASDCRLTFVRCCCAEFSAALTTDSRVHGQMFGHKTNPIVCINSEFGIWIAA